MDKQAAFVKGCRISVFRLHGAGFNGLQVFRPLIFAYWEAPIYKLSLTGKASQPWKTGWRSAKVAGQLAINFYNERLGMHKKHLKPSKNPNVRFWIMTRSWDWYPTQSEISWSVPQNAKPRSKHMFLHWDKNMCYPYMPDSSMKVKIVRLLATKNTYLKWKYLCVSAPVLAQI